MSFFGSTRLRVPFVGIIASAILLGAGFADPHPERSDQENGQRRGHTREVRGHQTRGDRHEGHRRIIGSILDLLGIDRSCDRHPAEEQPDPPTPPDTVTDDPFEADEPEPQPDGAGGDDGGEEGGQDPEFGSVPLIQDDEESVDYILEKLVSSAREAAWSEGENPSTEALRTAYKSYAEKLVKSLSQLTQEQQNYVFYGRER